MPSAVPDTGKPERALGAHRRRETRRRSSGATYTESLLLIALIAIGCLAALEAFGKKVADVARRQGDAIATLSWDGGSRGNPPAPRPQAPPPSKPPEKKDPQKKGGGFGDFLKGALDFAIDMSPIGDVKTLFDPNASVFDKVLAGVSLASSFVPGAGQVVKGAAVAVKVGKAANRTADVVDNARDTKRAGDELEEGGDLIGGAGKKKKDDDPPDEDESPASEQCANGRCNNGQNGKNGTCFAAGTLVHTAHGLRPIEEVREGDLVWSRSDVTGRMALQRVLRRFVTPDRVLLQILFSSGSEPPEPLRVTPPHPFWTLRGWVAAGELTLDDAVLLRSGEWARIIAAETLDEGASVYNFEVEGFHTYFVGEAGAWVHNESKGPECPEDDTPSAEEQRRAEEDAAWGDREAEQRAETDPGPREEYGSRDTSHSEQRRTEGRDTESAHAHARDAEIDQVYRQNDGRYVVRREDGIEDIFEPDGAHVTTLGNPRSQRAHENLQNNGTRRPVTRQEFDSFKDLFGG